MVDGDNDDDDGHVRCCCRFGSFGSDRWPRIRLGLLKITVRTDRGECTDISAFYVD